MYVPGTEMHMITFSIIMLELVILFFQLIYFLERPSEKSRLWYLILLYLLIQYNVMGGLFPADNIPIPIIAQNIMAYTSAIIMSMYFAFYFYKAFNLEHFRWFAIYGTFNFVFLPFIATFIVPYLLTDNLTLSRKLFVVVPFIYCLVFIFNITKAVRKKYRNSPEGEYGSLFKERIISVYLALAFWISLPIITYFNGSQVLEVCMTNAGFLVMTITYIRSSVYNAKFEHRRLKISEQKLQKLNKELQKKVEDRTKKLVDINEQKTNTLINLTHETKTPLTLINNYLDEYINKYGINEELAVVKFNTEKLTKDITNLFDLERFEKGIEIYDYSESVDFSLSLKNSLVLFKSLAQHKNIRIHENIEDNILIQASSEAIGRVVNNLIENAIKYTEKKGEIKVKLYEKNGDIIFSIADNGIGIPSDMQNKIFEPYFQINKQKKNAQGLGMGLSIVKKIIDGLEGSIAVQSKTANESDTPGSTVTIILPRSQANVAEATKSISDSGNIRVQMSSPIPEDSIYDSELLSILVVEDNLSMLNYLSVKLKKHYNVYIAKSGTEALRKLDNLKDLDLIVSDVMMDSIDGFKFYQIVSERKEFGHVPFIFLTARTGKKDKLKGLSLGAVDYLEKPFSINELIYKIDSVLNNQIKQKNAIVSQVFKAIQNQGVVDHSSLEKNSFEENCQKYNLTLREVEIVKLIAQGLTYHTIAEQLHISSGTVSKHVQNIFNKVEVNSKIDLMNRIKVAI
ncbi:signal transduction histidine kinase/DNA-binding NarL/FixJ family response regulator [Catalinimonas alkaloidigena]|uniref:ATP-binding response regulator n=1 Tax=Catalinimonas alkaloidigena TaxID=1075417 RepID=UPI002404ED83|nr:ATP-binding protein [Catalinimonas alkaloidigena]MDF9801294.1 signal transduction histidine kinase/DNA-binding NarL/FixJ family response regulator [Catalinimonas alkaloidigena]